MLGSMASSVLRHTSAKAMPSVLSRSGRRLRQAGKPPRPCIVEAARLQGEDSMFDSATIACLLKPAAPAVSLYLPLAVEQRDVRGPAVRLRELLGKAESMMQRDGIDQRRVQELLAPLHQVADETD